MINDMSREDASTGTSRDCGGKTCCTESSTLYWFQGRCGLPELSGATELQGVYASWDWVFCALRDRAPLCWSTGGYPSIIAQPPVFGSMPVADMVSFSDPYGVDSLGQLWTSVLRDPIRVVGWTGLSTVSAVRSGLYTFACVLEDGSRLTRCIYGSNTEVPVETLERVRWLALPWVILEDGSVKWADIRGVQTTEPQSITWIDQPDLRNASSVSGSASQGCAAMGPSGIKCWKTLVQATGNQREFTQINGAPDAVRVSVGEKHACAVSRSGAVYCWGDNDRGQLGNGERTSALADAVQVMGVTDAVDVLIGGSKASFALTAQGKVLFWGRVEYDLAVSGDQLTPRAIPTL